MDRDNKGRFVEGHKIRVGMKHTKETKDSLSKSHLGIPTWNKGKKLPPLSDKHKENISKSMQGKSHGFKKGHISWNKGKKGFMAGIPRHNYDNKFREKLRKANEGKKLSKETIRKCLKRRNKSSLELKFENIINKFNLPYKFVGNGKFFIERKNPDFINCNGEKIAIEVFYKRHKAMFKSKLLKLDYSNIDKWKNARLKIFKNYGWDIIFFDETQVNEDYILKKLGGD